jgi:hypothetical protein
MERRNCHRLQAAGKCHIGKTFSYFAVHDTNVGFAPSSVEQDRDLTNRNRIRGNADRTSGRLTAKSTSIKGLWL